MIDLAQALKDQEDLDPLCRGEGIEPGEPNDHYGFARILKAYAGYPEELPVAAVIPHGVYLDATQMLEQEDELRYRTVLNYPAFRAAAWQQRPERVVVPSASPFLYALEMFSQRFPVPDQRKGTLFFGGHTRQTLRTSANWDAVARDLVALDERYQPVTVCVHNVDYLKGLHEPFVRRGLPVVSAGHGWDPEFVYRWLHLLSRHEYAASNDVGSAVFYATRAGTPVFLLDELVEHFFDPSLYVVFGTPASEQARETRNRVAEMFRDDSAGADVALRETVDYLLGAENFKSPEALREDLERAASLPLLD